MASSVRNAGLGSTDEVQDCFRDRRAGLRHIERRLPFQQGMGAAQERINGIPVSVIEAVYRINDTSPVYACSRLAIYGHQTLPTAPPPQRWISRRHRTTLDGRSKNPWESSRMCRLQVQGEPTVGTGDLRHRRACSPRRSQTAVRGLSRRRRKRCRRSRRREFRLRVAQSAERQYRRYQRTGGCGVRNRGAAEGAFSYSLIRIGLPPARRTEGGCFPFRSGQSSRSVSSG